MLQKFSRPSIPKLRNHLVGSILNLINTVKYDIYLTEERGRVGVFQPIPRDFPRAEPEGNPAMFIFYKGEWCIKCLINKNEFSLNSCVGVVLLAGFYQAKKHGVD